MDDLDKAFTEIIDGAVSGDISSRLDKINQVLKKYGLGVFQEKPLPPPEPKIEVVATIDGPGKIVGEQVEDSGTTQVDYDYMDAQKLAAFLDLSASQYEKAYGEAHFWFKRKEQAIARQILAFIASALCYTVHDVQTRAEMDLSPQMKKINELKELIIHDARMRPKWVRYRNAKLQQSLNIARSSLAVCEAFSLEQKHQLGNKMSTDLYNFISEIYNLTIDLQRYVEVKI